MGEWETILRQNLKMQTTSMETSLVVENRKETHVSDFSENSLTSTVSDVLLQFFTPLSYFTLPYLSTEEIMQMLP